MPREQAVCNLSDMRIIYGRHATNNCVFYDGNESYIVNPNLILSFNLNLFVPSLFYLSLSHSLSHSHSLLRYSYSHKQTNKSSL